ncbi:hypothetical protein BGZ80_000830 [Entomortierella chlamydospora]|uniref:RRM domain-containing protein n=1 Tax=Entomortierella chlamydospora TaxID=101097 RepID=A0A9P6MSU9_9FUNG|nr:hypothetical protein BGZ79_000836 [Entomortierella chlamydospora]KAG0011244.1 hypothetical protein BGZ80_000830 [Entomortierella chlamydospora]
MVIHSVDTTSSASSSSSSSPSHSPTTSSSPSLLSSPPSTATTTPLSHSSPTAKDLATVPDKSTSSTYSHSIFEDQDLTSVRAINILNDHHTNNQSTTDGISDPFGLSDYFSSSVPKAGLTNGHQSNSLHIGSLTSGLSGLSLAAQGLSSFGNNSNSKSSLSSGLYGYSNNSNGSLAFSNTPTINPAEEISTIFVVGFPDDMQEREFQNMFVFTPGFEAATLKIPHKDQQEDDALTLGVNGVNPRKQIIGFAKFRSHQEALQAISVLSGRRVDAEKGSLLKAEMAKKNLHTRRGLSNELVATPGPGVTSAAVPPTPIGSTSIHPVNINGKKTPHPLQHRNSLAGSAAYDAFHSVPCSPALPSDLLTPSDYASSYDFYADVYAPNNLSNLSFAESFGGRLQQQQQQQQQQSQQQSELSSSFLGRQSTFDMRVDPLSMGSFSNNIGGLSGSISGSFSNSISSSFTSRNIGFTGSQRFNKSFLDLDPETPTSTMSFLSKSIPAHTERGFNNGLFNSDDMSNNRFQGLPINTAAAAALATTSLPSPNVASPGFRTPINPGDQNPPCNTLYVGNLPMNTSEDELRTLFSRCIGYRRMCFRTKANGPMCFVEFENVECATQALNDLYGNPLSNSVKGGIRLSFSKNPLGVRNSQPSSLANQLHNMNNGTAPYLDRRDSMTAMFEQHY